MELQLVETRALAFDNSEGCTNALDVAVTGAKLIDGLKQLDEDEAEEDEEDDLARNRLLGFRNIPNKIAPRKKIYRKRVKNL